LAKSLYLYENLKIPHMKQLLIIIFCFSFSIAIGQATKMVLIKSQIFQMNGVQNGEPVEKRTKVFGLTVNYETGEINGVVNLLQLDLLNKGREISDDPEKDALKIRGFLPLNDILYNQNEKQQYKVELDLIIKDFKVVALFDFNVTYAKNTSVRFHTMQAISKVNLNDFEIEDLNGFEPDVNIILVFQMMNLQR
jgi:hypothetical protein